MAKIKVLGTALVMESSMKIEDVKKVAKYAPETLKILDEDGDVEFMVKVASPGTAGSINDFVVAFADTTTSAEGKAQVTLAINVWDGTDLKEMIADEFGTALVKLQEIESKFPAIVAKVQADREAVLENITIG